MDPAAVGRTLLLIDAGINAIVRLETIISEIGELVGMSQEEIANKRKAERAKRHQHLVDLGLREV